MKRTRQWLMPLVHLFFPRYCAVCGERLREDEEALCMECILEIPRTNLHLQKDNLVERLFWGKFPLERATAFYYYHHQTPYAELVHLFKYKGRRDLAVTLGKLMASELLPTGFFEGVDSLIPVPLHRKRLRHRGYNQSECLARGISEVTGIPLQTQAVIRVKNTETQVQKSAQQRYENMRDVFLLQAAPDELRSKHVLLIDDVLTTSSTLTSCADALKNVPDIRISVLALTLAGH